MSEAALTLSATDFELFAVPKRFAQDRAALDARWKELQREAHPDKFAAQSAASQRLAMQWSVRINEAYQRLKDPLKRAAYLCELAGAPINAHDNTAMPAEFLMQQMAWRESLEEAQDAEQVQSLHDEVMRCRTDLLAPRERAQVAVMLTTPPSGGWTCARPSPDQGKDGDTPSRAAGPRRRQVHALHL